MRFWSFKMPSMGAFFLMIVLSSVVLSGCLPAIRQKQVSRLSLDYLKGAVVEGFPTLPAYAGAQVVESYGNKGYYGASFVTGDGVNKVVKYYSENLKKLGWEAKLTQPSQNYYVIEVKNDKNQGSIIINTAADGKKTAISMFVEPR